MGLFSFFFPRVIHRTNSRINGKIEVVEWLGKRAIKVQGLEQSGPMIEKIWELGIREITNYQLLITNVLILGLGGGSAIKVFNKYFPESHILGIEIDSMMIKLGNKYLGLSEYKNLEIKVADAFEWIKQVCLNDLNHLSRYDLVLVDLYLGRKIPEQIEDQEFLKNLKKLLRRDGIIIFNRLREKNKQAKFKIFLDKLKKIYHHIKIVKPVINYLIICS